MSSQWRNWLRDGCRAVWDLLQEFGKPVALAILIVGLCVALGLVVGTLTQAKLEYDTRVTVCQKEKVSAGMRAEDAEVMCR